MDKRRWWDSVQQKHYVNMLFRNINTFNSPDIPKRKKVYKAMSNKIIFRTNKQCSNFHRRMKRKYRSVDNIIRKLSSLLYPQLYRQWENNSPVIPKCKRQQIVKRQSENKVTKRKRGRFWKLRWQLQLNEQQADSSIKLEWRQ